MEKIKTLPSLRQHNQYAILKLLFEKQTSSRAELAKLLHMSKPAVTDNLIPLLEMGIVREMGEGPASRSGGRKPILLHFNPNYRYIATLDLNFKKPIFSLGNLNGDIINQFSLNIPEKITCPVRISLVKNAVATLLDSGGVKASDLAYILISMPGIIREAGYDPIFNPQFKPWFECNFSQTLSEEFGCTTLIRNDVKMAATGEFYFGAGKEHKNLFYISCGVGLGSAFILNNRLHDGMHQASGGIERFISHPSPNNQSNLEDLVSIDGIIRRLKYLLQASGMDTDSIGQRFDTFDEVVLSYQAKDPLVMSVIQEVGETLGCTISNVCNLLDIDQVILGGEYLIFQDQLIPIMQKIVDGNTLFNAVVKAATLGKNSGTFGMLETARQIYFKSICNT